MCGDGYGREKDGGVKWISEKRKGDRRQRKCEKERHGEENEDKYRCLAD